MTKRILIETKLQDRYKNFLKYCLESEKVFIDELSESDFIAYRTKYSVPREEIENIKMKLLPESEIDLFAEKINKKLQQTLKERFNIINIEPYKNILVTDLSFKNRIQSQMKRNNCSTLYELLNYSLSEILVWKNFGRDSIKNVIEVLEEFFKNPNHIFDTTFEDTKQNNESSKFIAEENLKKFADKMIYAATKKERQFEIISGRVEGKTLKAIGKDFNLTRERVRQIENNAVKTFSKYNAINLKKFFDSILELFGGKSFLTFEELKKIIGESSAKIIWFFISKMDLNNKNFYLDSSNSMIVFKTKNQISYDEVIDTLPTIWREDELLKEIERLVKEKNYSEELLKLKIKQIYKRRGKFFYKGYLTLNFQCGYILREKFPNGYKIADKTHYNEFVRYLREIFDYKEKISQRALDAKIAVYVGVLCDRGRYIHPDFLHIPQKIILLINDYIENSDRTVLPYKEIFTALKENFVGTQITNQYFLQGVIKYFGTPYNLLKDCLTKDANLNLAAEFNNFVAKNGEVTMQEIKSEFISFQDYNVILLLQHCPEIICIGVGKYLHSTQLNLQENESVEIEKFLQNICVDKPVSAHYLYNLFGVHFQDFLYRNKIEDSEKLFGILKYMFNGKFGFSRPYISHENISGMTNKKALLKHLEGKIEMKIDDIFNICKEQGIKYLSKIILIENLSPEFIRINELYLRRPESIGVNDEIIAAVAENVKLAMNRNGGWQSAKTFPSFEYLPSLEISWNSFLLESIAKISESNFKILHNPSTSGEFSTAVFVSEDFAEDDFNSFCLKVLIDEQERTPFQTKDEIFNWLNEKGLANKKLPKIIEEHLQFKADRVFVIE